MKYIHAAFLGIVVFALASCKKNVDPNPGVQPGTLPGKVTGKGTPAGNIVSATIDASGGTLTAEDGGLSVIVPPGAVSAATVFSVQPITDSVPNGIGLSYRLMPEGTQFARPVTIRFHYSDQQIRGSSPETLFAAYQNGQGVWQAMPGVDVDSVQHTISVQSGHFSDWAAFSSLSLQVSRYIIGPNQESKLTVQIEDMLQPLDNPVPVPDYSLAKVDWSHSGADNYIAVKQENSLTIIAGSSPQPQARNVNVVATVSNILTNRGRKAKKSLQTTIKIANEYMTVRFKGQEYDLTNAIVYVANNRVSITGASTPVDASQGFVAFGYPGSGGAGEFSFGDIDKGNVDVIAEFNNDSKTYGVWYGQPRKYTSGKLTISDWNAYGMFVIGSFSGSVAYTNAAGQVDLETISGSFNAVK